MTLGSMREPMCVRKDQAMKALILYVLFASAGTVAAIFAGLFVERSISANASTFVFLVLFFSDLALAWIAVILVF